MKITKQQLKQIIMEELEVALSEEGLDMSKLHKPTSLPGKTKKSRSNDDSKKDLDMSKLHKPTPLPGKSEEDDSEELPEAFDPSKMKAPKDYKGDADAARKRAASSVVQQDLKSRSSYADPTGKAAPDAFGQIELAADTASPVVSKGARMGADIADKSITTGGNVAKNLAKASGAISGLGLAGGARSISNTLGDREASTIQKGARIGSEVAQGAADLASIAPNLAARTIGGRAAGALTGPAAGAIGAALAGYEGGKALQKPLAKAGIIPDLGKTVGVTDIDWRPKELAKALPGVGKHTGGTFDPKKMKAPGDWDPEKKDAAIARATKVKGEEDAKTQMRQYKSRMGEGKRDDEDDIPKPGKNLAEAWGFSMDLDKLNESTSGHVTPAKD